MVGSADVLLDSYFSTDISGELGRDPWISVGDDFHGNSIMREDLPKICFGKFLSSHLFPTWDKKDRLGTIVICNSEDGIEVGRGREFRDPVHRDCFEGVG